MGQGRGLTTTSPSLGFSLSLVMASALWTVEASLVSTQEWVSPPRGTWSTRTRGVATPTPHTPAQGASHTSVYRARLKLTSTLNLDLEIALVLDERSVRQSGSRATDSAPRLNYHTVDPWTQGKVKGRRERDTYIPILLVSRTTCCCTSFSLTGPGSGVPQIHSQKHRIQVIPSRLKSHIGIGGTILVVVVSYVIFLK